MNKRRTIERVNGGFGPQKPYLIDRDIINGFHQNLVSSLLRAGYLSRKSNPLDKNEGYTMGAISFVSSNDVPFRQERLAIHRNVGQQDYLRLVIRNVEHDSGLVHFVHDLMKKYERPLHDISQTRKDLTVYDFLTK